MSALDEQARFLVAKYGTSRASTGSAHWAPVSNVIISPEVIFVVLGLILLGFVLFAVIRDLLAARERETQVRRAYNVSFNE